jgi:thioredoxin-disulfide reductase
MSESEHVRLAIIGGGPAAFTAALYSGRANLNPLCIEGYESGGQIARSYRVENYPGIGKDVSGADLSSRIREQAEGFGARMVFDDVQSIDFSERPFRIVTNETEFLADSLILATGSKARRLGLPSELEFDGRGVAYCAVCDGPFFAGKRVAVVGGGDAAVEEALLLQETAASVTLIHRRREMRAGAILQDALRSAGNIDVLIPHIVDEILGNEEGVTGLRVRNTETGSLSQLDIDGIFISIGHDPSSSLFVPAIETDSHGYVVRQGGSTATNIPGVFVAGDVADPRYRQAITAAGSGCQAAIDAERWLLAHRMETASAARH